MGEDQMDVNLTGQLWGMPFNLAGQITKNPNDSAIGLIDIVIIILSIIFIVYMLKIRAIPVFGEFWFHQETRPLSEHEGERFIFRKSGERFISYRPTHDRKFWKPYLQIFVEILSPMKSELQYMEKLANWMLAISGGALILIASNFDRFQIAEFEHYFYFEDILVYHSPDKLLFGFILAILLISAFFHFVSRLNLYYLESDLETESTFIPLPEGIADLKMAEQSIENLRKDLVSFKESNIPAEYSALVARFESIEKNLDIKRANNWRRFQIGNIFFIAGLFSLVIYYLLFIISN
jgi:hypothetical protein